MSFALRAMEPEKIKLPAVSTIYQAIDLDDHDAITFFAHHGQANVHEIFVDNGTTETKTHTKTCACFCGFPLCCGVGIELQTPLYYALTHEKFEIAQLLVASGARLTNGKIHVEPPRWCGLSSRRVQVIDSSAHLLVCLAHKNRAAHTCLSNFINDQVTLLGDNKKINTALYTQFLLLRDDTLMNAALRAKLITIDYLVHTAVQEKIPLNTFYPSLTLPIAHLCFSKHGAKSRLYKALLATGDQQLADLFVRYIPSLPARLIHDTQLKKKHPKIIQHLKSIRAERKAHRWDQRLAPTDL